MRVALDGRSLSTEMVGVGQYVAHLVSYLLQSGHRCLLLVGKNKKIPPFPHPERLELVKVPGDTDHTSEREHTENVLFPKILAEKPVALYHATDNRGVPDLSLPTVLTIHDIIPLRLPGELTATQRVHYRQALQTSIRHALHVLTVSRYSRREIIDEFSLKPSRISVIYNGYQVADPANVTEKDFSFSLPKKFFIYVGGLSRRKNIFNTLWAYAQFIERNPSGPNFILVGKLKKYMRDEYTSWQKFVKERKIQNKILFTGYLNDQQLAFLRSRAMLSLYLSHYEGFGLPILEAMAQNVPVVTANRTATKEIAGQAALLVDPDNINAASQAMERLSSDEKLRARLVTAGKKRSRSFSWEKCAKETLKVYEQLSKHVQS